MKYSMSTPLRSAFTGTPDFYFGLAKEKGSSRINDVRDYLDESYRLCVASGINYDICVIQSWHETSESGVPWTSQAWRVSCNPAGIGVTDDSKRTWFDFGDGTTAGRAHVVHLALYSSRLNDFPEALAPYRHEDPRWDAAVSAGYAGVCTTLGDLTGTWAVDPYYTDKLVAHLASIADRFTEPQEDSMPNQNQHIYAVSAGHRNNHRGGARGEIEWTPGATRALAESLRAKGATVYIVHEHDGDNDPDFTHQGLDRIGHIVCDIDERYWPITAYISMHYNGGGSPGFHAIFPDGWDDGDEKQNNPKDVELCRNIRDAVKATKTVRMLSWTADSPGVMSEHETGAVSGRYGYRLAEMRSSKGIQPHAVRVILEAGSIDTSEREFITNPAWVRDVYCEAICAGLRETFGAFPNEVDGQPVPEPTKPETVYAKAAPAPWAAPLRDGTASSVILPDGTTWFAVNNQYRAKANTPREQYAIDSSHDIGEPVPAGSVFMVDAVGTGTDGGPWALSPWDTRLRLKDLELVEETPQPDLVAELAAAQERELGKLVDVLDGTLNG